MICVGPWHSPLVLIRALVSMKTLSRLIYLPRGMKLILARAAENDTASSVAHINELALLQWQELLDQ